MKTRTTISREMTINCGNFSNIKPSVSISLVHELEDTNIIYAELAGIIDSLLALETIALGAEMSVVSNNGWDFYRQALENSMDDINRALQDHIKVICSTLEMSALEDE